MESEADEAHATDEQGGKSLASQPGRSAYPGLRSRLGGRGKARVHLPTASGEFTSRQLAQTWKNKGEVAHLRLPLGHLAREVQYKTDTPGPNHVIVIQQIAPLGIWSSKRVDQCLLPRLGTASKDTNGASQMLHAMSCLTPLRGPHPVTLRRKFLNVDE